MDNEEKKVILGPYDPKQPIDWEAGIAQYGSEDLFETMVQSYEDMTLNQSIEILIVALREKDYVQIQEVSHSLKGTSGYIAAHHFSQTNDKLQKVIKQKVKMEDGGQKTLTADLTQAEIEEAFNLSLESLEKARDIKIFLAQLGKREPDVTTVEKYIMEAKELVGGLMKKQFSINIEEDDNEPKAKCALCSKCSIF